MMRSTRDLLRRRMHLMRKRSELLAHIQNTNSPYCLPQFSKKIAYKTNRQGLPERFTDPSVRKSMEVDLALIDHYDKLLNEVELYITKTAKVHDVKAFYRLRSVGRHLSERNYPRERRRFRGEDLFVNGVFCP